MFHQIHRSTKLLAQIYNCDASVRYCNKFVVSISSVCSKNMEKNLVQCEISSLDHLVLTVQNMENSITFYSKVLGMSPVKFGANRHALQFGNQKINLHEAGNEFTPHAKTPTPGSADLCFVTKTPLESWVLKMRQLGVKVEEGPVNRTGAIGPMTSIYVRDPDKNLIEIAFYG